MLLIPPYTFYRKNQNHNWDSFVCAGCSNNKNVQNKKSVKANVQRSVSENGDESYKLISWPDENEHYCSPSFSEHLIKKATREMYSEVTKNPEVSLPDLFENIRDTYADKLDAQTKVEFLSQFPNFTEMRYGLNNH